VRAKDKHKESAVKQTGKGIGKKERGKLWTLLKMIDDLQTPKHKTNHKYRRCFPLLVFNFILENKTNH